MSGIKQTLLFKNMPYILSAYAIAGEKEGGGPMSKWFDNCLSDDTYGESTWEKSESKMLKTAMSEAMRRAGRKRYDRIYNGNDGNAYVLHTYIDG